MVHCNVPLKFTSSKFLRVTYITHAPCGSDLWAKCGVLLPKIVNLKAKHVGTFNANRSRQRVGEARVRGYKNGKLWVTNVTFGVVCKYKLPNSNCHSELDSESINVSRQAPFEIDPESSSGWQIRIRFRTNYSLKYISLIYPKLGTFSTKLPSQKSC